MERNPRELAEQASIWLACMYEENTYRRTTKDGRLQAILPEFEVQVKRTDRAKEYSDPCEESSKI